MRCSANKLIFSLCRLSCEQKCLAKWIYACKKQKKEEEEEKKKRVLTNKNRKSGVRKYGAHWIEYFNLNLRWHWTHF